MVGARTDRVNGREVGVYDMCIMLDAMEAVMRATWAHFQNENPIWKCGRCCTSRLAPHFSPGLQGRAAAFVCEEGVFGFLTARTCRNSARMQTDNTSMAL